MGKQKLTSGDGHWKKTLYSYATIFNEGFTVEGYKWINKQVDL